MAFLRDQHWVRQSFLVSADNLEKTDYQNRTYSEVSNMFVDTTPGGNIPINPLPQYCRYTDIRHPGRFGGNAGITDGSKGLGRVYGEVYQANQQVIHLRMGVPNYTPMTQFFTGFYNTGAGRLSRTGRADSVFYMVGRAAGFIVPLMSWKLLAVHLLGVGARFMLQKPSSRFYYLKPTMPLYWNAVTTMVNRLAVNRGIIPRTGFSSIDPNTGAREINAQLNQLLPDIFKPNGGIDVFALANRGKRLERKFEEMRGQALNNPPDNGYTPEEISRKMQLVAKEVLQDDRPSLWGDTQENHGNSYFGKWLSSNPSKPPNTESNTDASSVTEAVLDLKSGGETFMNFLKAELDDGGAFASFRVNATGPVTDSFSNTAGESEIANKINSMSSSARNTKFNFAGGNIVGGAVGEVLGGITRAATDFVAGAAESLAISGIASLAGAAFVDIPKHWQSSSGQLPHANYTVELRSPYGNPISQLINLYVPLAMLLAAALPKSTGKQSYDAPFILEYYDKGRAQTRLGMIDSMTITRGVGNLGFNRDGHAMGIDVSFSIMDLTSIVHMPITEGFSLISGLAGSATSAAVSTAASIVPGVSDRAADGAGDTAAALITAAASGVFDEDNSFNDYMAVLAGMDIKDQIYSWRKLMLNVSRARANWDTYTDPSRFATFAADTMPGRLFSAFFAGTER
ncbi:hypothetical protein D3C71_78360 [compost metagenome]